MKLKKINKKIKQLIPSFIKIYNYGVFELWPGTSRNEAIEYYMDLALHAPQKECQRYLKIVDDLRKGKNNCGQNFQIIQER